MVLQFTILHITIYSYLACNIIIKIKKKYFLIHTPVLGDNLSEKRSPTYTWEAIRESPK